MVSKKCSKCGESFDALGNWQQTCKPCYAEMKQIEEAQAAASPTSRYKEKGSSSYTYTPETTLRICRSKGLEEANKSVVKASPSEILELAEIYAHWLMTGEVKGLFVQEERVKK